MDTGGTLDFQGSPVLNGSLNRTSYGAQEKRG